MTFIRAIVDISWAGCPGRRQSSLTLPDVTVLNLDVHELANKFICAL